MILRQHRSKSAEALRHSVVQLSRFLGIVLNGIDGTTGLDQLGPRLIIWLVIGLVVLYFAYGQKHSKVQDWPAT